jgi:hypothetical protein
MKSPPTLPPSLPYLGVFMWRTKSSYTSEGWYRSMAAGTLSSAAPLLRFSFPGSRNAATVPFAAGGVRAFLSSYAGVQPCRAGARGGGDFVSVGGRS